MDTRTPNDDPWTLRLLDVLLRAGLIAVSDILSDVQDISFIRFGGEDVVRHKLVQRIVAAYDEHGAREREARAEHGPTPRS